MRKPEFVLSPEGQSLLEDLRADRFVDNHLLEDIYIENVVQAFKNCKPDDYKTAIEMFKKNVSLLRLDPCENETRILSDEDKAKAKRKLVKIEALALLTGCESMTHPRMIRQTACVVPNCESVRMYFAKLEWWERRRLDADGTEYTAKNNYYEQKEEEHPF